VRGMALLLLIGISSIWIPLISRRKTFILKHGYEIFGILEDCPSEHKQYFLKRNCKFVWLIFKKKIKAQLKV